MLLFIPTYNIILTVGYATAHCVRTATVYPATIGRATATSNGRQFSHEVENDKRTEISNHIYTNWTVNEEIVILWTTTDVDLKNLPTSFFDEINQQLKYYYVLLQRKGYSLYKIVKKTLLPAKPIHNGYHLMFKPIGNVSISFGLNFNFGASGALSFN